LIRLAEKGPAPPGLQSKKVKLAMAKIIKKVADKKPLFSKDFPDYWRTDEGTRKKIWEYSYRKCCYCERKRDLKRDADIDHFRPKTEIAEDGKPGYWWLAYDWNNLFFSCKACNQTKSTKFPLISGKRVRVSTGDINLEKPYLPHPADEDPEKLIEYIWDESSPIEQVRPRGKDHAGRGDKTIKVLALDREELIIEQSRSLLPLMAYVEIYKTSNSSNQARNKKKVIAHIKRLTGPQNDFAGIKRAFFIKQGLGDFVSKDR
jgi:uncharacterized protein (TIGR02646 family)